MDLSLGAVAPMVGEMVYSRQEGRFFLGALDGAVFSAMRSL
jgi:hypothetical protein